MSTPSPIPSALAASIIETYAEGIRPGIAFILIQTMFATLLVPLLILLFALSTPQTRRRPIFILNVISVCMAMISTGVGVHILIRTILSPFANVHIPEAALFYTWVDLWKVWVAEAVLLLRVVLVFPRRRLPPLLAFPIMLKIARAAFNIVFCVKWEQLLLGGTTNDYILLQSMPTYLFKTMITLELLDNSYVSFLFLWRLRQQRQSSVLESEPIVHDSAQSYHSKLQKLFWIASTNFVFPLIFNLSKLIAVFAGSPIAVYTSLDQVNAYIAIICTVFATVWSSTISFKEAIAQGDRIVSLKSVVFRMETMDASPDPHSDDSLNTVKSGIWEERK
ncbi:hypothetical protein MVEN_00729200 [Mycena venus]|uniref:Uncharacterized protein n=1 Tax=Mycena venus TaxID=2733690 RepID=A0A8H6YJU5_9AGAR|nr:hypothetical protein MVEN_00729200 [Mycena venus]